MMMMVMMMMVMMITTMMMIDDAPWGSMGLEGDNRVRLRSIMSLYSIIRILFTIFIFIMIIKPECDIFMDFDTNEYPNLFMSRK